MHRSGSLIRHYAPDGQESMRRYADWLEQGLQKRDWQVASIEPPVRFGRLASKSSAGKWLGYLDKFALFGPSLNRQTSKAQLTILPDHSHGIYLHYLADRPHIVHVHDLLAIHSARDKIPENPTGATGKVYQRLIGSGLAKARNIICVSQTTADEFRRFFPNSPARINIVPNGLNFTYSPANEEEVQAALCSNRLSPYFPYILHVGGNQWYKNRAGVIEAFAHIAPLARDLHLLMVGKQPPSDLRNIAQQHGIEGRVHFLSGVSNADLRALYTGARCLFFPSLMEGFGWPIAEAQACGTTVVTTNRAPMTEVGGEAAIYIPPMPSAAAVQEQWARDAASTLDALLAETTEEQAHRREANLRNAGRFAPEPLMQQIVDIYEEILEDTPLVVSP